MPGYIMHLAVAKLVIDRLGISDVKDKMPICVGSIIADTMPRAEKKKSHFWNDETVKLLARTPDIDIFLEEYGNNINHNSFLCAYFTHLLMDKYFVDDYWGGHFILLNEKNEVETGYDEVKKIKLLDNGIVYDRAIFLSDDYYYGDYTLLREYIAKKYQLWTLFEHNPETLDIKKLAWKEIVDIIDQEIEYNSFQEINYGKSREKLLEMLKSVYDVKLEVEKAKTEVEEAPKLKVFNIDELEELILYSADKLEKLLRFSK